MHSNKSDQLHYILKFNESKTRTYINDDDKQHNTTNTAHNSYDDYLCSAQASLTLVLFHLNLRRSSWSDLYWLWICRQSHISYCQVQLSTGCLLSDISIQYNIDYNVLIHYEYSLIYISNGRSKYWVRINQPRYKFWKVMKEWKKKAQF